MYGISAATKEITGTELGKIPYEEILAGGQPVIIRGAVKDWILVQKGLESAAGAMEYLKSFDVNRPITGKVGAPEIEGRFFYTEGIKGPNYKAGRFQFSEFLDTMFKDISNPRSPYYYIGSTDVDLFLPGLHDENKLSATGSPFVSNNPLVSIWIGNKTIAAAHYDMSHNIACCAVGKRRFILFPPEQVHNLYPGPLEPTPGGQAVTMVDFKNPDLEAYPRFQEATKAGQVAELEPGDILYFPPLWWHQVEALNDFNAMINYWWNETPAYIDNPMNTLLHGMLSLRDRPEAEKKAWQELFNYYVFGPADTAGKHLPKGAQGALARLDDMAARRLRAQVLQRINR